MVTANDEKTPPKRIRVFDYTDYRTFLKDYYNNEKKVSGNFSYRYFAKKAHISSVGLYKDVVERRKILGRSLIIKFSQALDLSPKEAEYFENMVYFNDVQTIEERKLYFQKMMNSYESKAYKIDSTVYEYYSKWYYSVIMTLLSYYPFKGDYKALASQLNPPIRPDQAKKSIQVLEKLGIVEKNTKGYYVLTNNTLTANVQGEDQIHSLKIINFQKTMVDMGYASYDINEWSNLNMSSMTMTVTEDSFKLLKDDINNLRKKFAALASREASPDRVYQLNLQFFPLTRIIEK